MKPDVILIVVTLVSYYYILFSGDNRHRVSNIDHSHNWCIHGNECVNCSTNSLKKGQHRELRCYCVDFKQKEPFYSFIFDVDIFKD